MIDCRLLLGSDFETDLSQAYHAIQKADPIEPINIYSMSYWNFNTFILISKQKYPLKYLPFNYCNSSGIQ
jgi:hypothetical protein